MHGLRGRWLDNFIRVYWCGYCMGIVCGVCVWEKDFGKGYAVYVFGEKTLKRVMWCVCRSSHIFQGLQPKPQRLDPPQSGRSLICGESPTSIRTDST